MLKILLLTSLFPNSKQPLDGISNLSRVRALRNEGCKVKIIAPIGLTPPERYFFLFPNFLEIFKHINDQILIPKEEIIDGFEVYHPRWFWLPRRLFWYYELHLLKIFAGKQINNIIEKFKPDAIISTCTHPVGTYSKYLKKKYDIPIIAIAEGSDILINPYKYPGWKFIEKSLNRSCDKLICVSNFMYKNVKRHMNLKNLTVVENGYNKILFNYYPKKDSDTKKKKIISVGYFGYVKGHDILLKAMRILGDQFYLTLIGDGELREKYLNYVKKNNLNERVKFIGKVKHKKIRSFLSKSDIFCMPSRSESFGIAVVEAMACGLPVVGTKIGGIAEKIIDNFNGFLCQWESPEDLARKIEKASKTKWNHKKIAKWTKNNFSWEKWAKDILLIYNETKQTKSVY